MVLPFQPSTNNNIHNEPPRVLTDEEQLLLAIDQGVYEVNISS